MAKLTSWLRVSAFAGALMFAAPTIAVADPPAPPARPVPAIAPGVGLGIYDAAGNPAGGCTAGFLAHGAAGQPVMISVGHCDHGGEVDIKWSKTGTYEKIGAFITKVFEPGNVDVTEDIGLIRLDSSTIPSDLRVIGIRPVVGVTSDVKTGDQLCHYGDASGLQCGPIVKVTDSKVMFAAKNEKGDSGGPVYIRSSDGTATAVGLHIGSDANGNAVAELVKPWLEKWQLTLDTPRPGPQVNPIGYR